MSNMLSTITPKSDQANYDDFLGGITKTIKITKVDISSGDQPASLHHEGDNGKPYKPCKSMRRVLVHVWGADANNYIGKSLTLYGDPNVIFAGAKVGGIRISHMSDIASSITMALTATKASRKPFTVQPLIAGSSKGRTSDFESDNGGSNPPPASTITADEWIADIESSPTLEGLKYKFSQVQRLFKNSPDFARIHAAKEKRKAELTTKETTDASIP